MKDVITRIVKDLFDVEIEVVLERPEEQFGDYSTNVALRLAAQVGKSPREIAGAIAARLAKQNIDAQVAGPGFINIRVNSRVFAQSLRQLIGDDLQSFGASQVGQGKTVLCEFPSPNMAKPFSVGHIRAALQGWSMHKLMKKMGYKVITDNHLGDTGTPFGKWVVGFLKYSSEQQLEKGGIDELARVYIEIAADIKKEEQQGGHQLKSQVQDWLIKLHSGDKEAVAYSERFNKISIDHMHQVMERLRISTDFELGESFFVSRGDALVNKLLQNGIAEESEGAVIVRLDEYGIDTPVILRKSNGAILYATTDLAANEYRDEQWSPEKVFYHTGQEQAFYFRQLDVLTRKVGLKLKVTHLWHGLVDQLNEAGEREKMSSRKGVVLLNDLLDRAEAKARELQPDGNQNDINAIALAAIKFNDFAADRKKGVLFDWEDMFSVHGFSGPAVQYACVRIKGIKKKSTLTSMYHENYDWEAEHALVQRLAEYPDLLLELHDNYELHRLAGYAYDLARTLNRYYEATPILKAEPNVQQSRLWLLDVTYQVLSDSLDILGIPIPEHM